MSDIFISYAREDRKTAQWLAEALEAQGWSVWWDTRLNAGEVWDEVIERELAAARCVIVLWSKASVQSYWVREEARKGLERRILVPLRIENVQLPLPFGGIQTGNLINWKGHREHPGFKKLMADVTVIIGPPPCRLPSPDGNGEDSASFRKNPWPEWLQQTVATIKHYFAVIAYWRPRKWHLAMAAGIALLVLGGISYSRYKPPQPPPDPSQRQEEPRPATAEQQPLTEPPQSDLVKKPSEAQEIVCHDQDVVSSLLTSIEKIGEAYIRKSINELNRILKQEQLLKVLVHEVAAGSSTETCFYEGLERLKILYEKDGISELNWIQGQEILLKGITRLSSRNNSNR